MGSESLEPARAWKICAWPFSVPGTFFCDLADMQFVRRARDQFRLVADFKLN
jgi:hypothetical protein